MKFAEIRIIVELDESKLTKTHQEQADRADKDPMNWDHPIENQVDEFIDSIRTMVGSTSAFNTLGVNSIKAVSFKVDTL